MKKNVLNTSFRSDTQATDSTCRGWRAKRAATKALRQTAPVIRRHRAKSSSVLPTCSATFTKWGPQAFWPKTWQSSMCDSHVSGCQLLPCMAVKAQTRPALVSPWKTLGLLVT